tara:strand:- start:113 stop:496 length:384 start_codon:yes stop_codon:yes gene_type:complete
MDAEWVSCPYCSHAVEGVSNRIVDQKVMVIANDEKLGSKTYIFFLLSLGTIFLAFSDNMGIYILHRHRDFELILASITFLILWMITIYLENLENKGEEKNEIIESVVIVISVIVLITITYFLFGPQI